MSKKRRSALFVSTELFLLFLWSRYKTWTIFSPSRVTFRCNSNVRFLRMALNLQHIKSRQCLVLQTQLLKTTTINFLNSLWLPCRYWCVRNRLVCIWIFETPMATFPWQALPGESKVLKKCSSASAKNNQPALKNQPPHKKNQPAPNCFSFTSLFTFQIFGASLLLFHCWTNNHCWDKDSKDNGHHSTKSLFALQQNIVFYKLSEVPF